MSSNSPIGFLAFAVLIPFVGLTAVTIIHFIQARFAVPRFKRQLQELNSRRAVRVRNALASTSLPDSTASFDIPAYPFNGWVELGSNGSVNTAGQCFPRGQAFDVIARDARHIPRAKVSCCTRDEVCIISHGQKFKCLFRDQQWHVELTTEAIA